MRRDDIYTVYDGYIDVAFAKEYKHTPEQLVEIAEQSFRRGFQQGVAASLEAIENGYSVTQLRDWKARLMKWRTARHKGKLKYPEWLARDGRQPQTLRRRPGG